MTSSISFDLKCKQKKHRVTHFERILSVRLSSSTESVRQGRDRRNVWLIVVATERVTALTTRLSVLIGVLSYSVLFTGTNWLVDSGFACGKREEKGVSEEDRCRSQSWK